MPPKSFRGPWIHPKDLTREELRKQVEEITGKKVVDIEPVVAQDPDEYKPWFPVGSENDLGFQNMFRMVFNVPPSAYQAGKDMTRGAIGMIAGSGEEAAALVSDYPETENRQMFRAPFEIVAGMGEEASRRILGTSDTENARMARVAGEYFKDRFWDNPAKHMVEDPVGWGTDLAGVLVPGLRAGWIPKSLRLANPAGAGPRVLGKTTQKVAGVVAEDTLPEILGFTTGYEPEAFRSAMAATRAGGRSAKDFWKALGRNIRLRDIGERVTEASKKFSEMKSKRYSEDLKGLIQEGDLDLGAVKNKFLKSLKDPGEEGMGIHARWEKGEWVRDSNDLIELNFDVKDDFGRIVGGKAIESKGEQQRIKKIVTRIIDWEDNSLIGMDALKQRLQQLYPKAISGQKRAGKIDKMAYQAIIDELNDKVIGYRQMSKKFETSMEVLEDFDSVLSGGSKNPEQLLNKISKSINDDFEIRQDIMAQLDALTGEPLRAQLAGQHLKDIAPKGLIGRSAAAGLVTGAGAAFITPWALAFFPMISPKAMGAFYGVMGAGQKQIDRVVKLMTYLNNKLPEGIVVDALSVGAVVQHVAENEGMHPGAFMEKFLGEEEAGEEAEEDASVTVPEFDDLKIMEEDPTLEDPASYGHSPALRSALDSEGELRSGPQVQDPQTEVVNIIKKVATTGAVTMDELNKVDGISAQTDPGDGQNVLVDAIKKDFITQAELDLFYAAGKETAKSLVRQRQITSDDARELRRKMLTVSSRVLGKRR